LRTSAPAIAVFVLKKEDQAPGDQVPKTVEGFLTDVQLLPVPADDGCYGVGLLIDPDKVHEEAVRRCGHNPGSSSARVVEDTSVLLLPGQPADFLVEENNRKVLNVKGCCLAVKHLLPAGVQFVSFVWDPGGEEPVLGNYAVKVRRPPFGMSSFLPEPSFGPESLLSCQVLSRNVDIRKALHEIGHTWCAYVSLRDSILLKAAENPGSQDPQGFFHWRDLFQCDSSPVRDFENQWAKQSDGRFKEEPVAFGQWRYSPTDLYLMGLAPRPSDPLLILRREGDVLASTDVKISPLELPAVTPAVGTQSFRHVFVVVTTSEERGEQLARVRVDRLRQNLAAAFEAATGGKGRLITEIRLQT